MAKGSISLSKIFRIGSKEVQELFATQIYSCTLCGRCREVYPIKINTRSLRVSMREDAVREKMAPNAVNIALDSAKKEHNGFFVFYPLYLL